MVTQTSKWSRWQRGKRYDFRLMQLDAVNTIKNGQFVARVQVRDTKAGEMWERIGRGRQEGRDFPTWINFRNKRMLLYDLLNFDEDEVPTQWSRWEKGKRYEVRLAATDLTLLSFDNSFSVRIEIKDRDGTVFPRVGRGRLITEQLRPTKVTFRGRQMYYNELFQLE